MPDDTPDLTAPAVLHHAYSTLQEQLPLHAEGYTCTTDDLLKGVLGVAVTRGTIESVCADLVGTPAPQTLRGYLTAQLRVEELPDWDRRLNTALAAEVPPRVRCHAQEIALDSQDRPSYGKAAQAAGLWVRGQATDGTTRFYRVATASLSLNGLRLTLALPFVLPTDDLVSVLAPWLTQVKGLGVQVTGLRLDKGCAGMAGRESLTAHPPTCPECLSEPGHDRRDAGALPGAQEFLHSAYLQGGPREGVHGYGGSRSGVHDGAAHPAAQAPGSLAALQLDPSGPFPPLCTAAGPGPLWQRDQLSLYWPSTGLDHGEHSRLSFRAACPGGCVAQGVAASALDLHASTASGWTLVGHPTVLLTPLCSVHSAGLRAWLWLHTNHHRSCSAPMLRNWVY